MGELAPQVTERVRLRSETAAAAALHPHPALRATFPRLGEGFRGDGKVSGVGGENPAHCCSLFCALYRE